MRPANLLFLEPLLIETLRKALPPRVHVKPLASLDGVEPASQPAPAVYVMYRGMQTGSKLEPIESTQTWATLIAVRNARDLDAGYDARQDAGELAAQVINTLLGATLANSVDTAGPLTAVAPPPPWFMDGHYYLPLLWSAPLLIWRDSCRN